MFSEIMNNRLVLPKIPLSTQQIKTNSNASPSLLYIHQCLQITSDEMSHSYRKKTEVKWQNEKKQIRLPPLPEVKSCDKPSLRKKGSTQKLLQKAFSKTILNSSREGAGKGGQYIRRRKKTVFPL